MKKAKASSHRVIIVTGGSGLVGQAIKTVVNDPTNPEKLDDEEWIFLGSKDGDLRSVKDTEAIFEKYKPTHVIHLAAFVGGLYRNMKYNVEFFNDNMAMNQNVIQTCHKYGVSIVEGRGGREGERERESGR